MNGMTATTATYTVPDHDTLMHVSAAPYTLRVRDMPKADRPREKLLAAGAVNLTQSELLAVLWGVGTRSEEVSVMARRVLHEYGERALLHQARPDQLAKALDIPITKACQLAAALELGRRAYGTERGGEPTQVRTADQAYHYFKPMGALAKEQLHGLYLSSQYQVIHHEVVSIGSLTSNVVHPREVFQPAISRGAVAVIVAHNHPSGSLVPSDADIEVTRQLIGAGKILGIELLDHLIIIPQGYCSILEAI